MDLHTSARLGTSAELAVALKAIEHGFTVCQPIGCYAHYDLIVDVNSVLIKVQVKNLRSVNLKKPNDTGLRCPNCRSAGKRLYIPYSPKDFDFAACYYRSTSSIFIVPFQEFVASDKIFNIYKTKQNLYREAWHLLEEFAALKPNWRLEEDFNPTYVKFNS